MHIKWVFTIYRIGALSSIIWLDYKMPLASAANVLQFLHGKEHFASTDKAVWSTSGRTIEMEEWWALGAQDFYEASKPGMGNVRFSSEEIVRQASRVCRCSHLSFTPVLTLWPAYCITILVALHVNMVGQEKLYYVGIGASAGGYDALTDFFSILSPGTRAAYFLSTYLPRYHKSKLIELIDRQTHMDVIEVNKSIEIRRSKVYLPAENMLMTFHNAATVAPKKIEAGMLHRTIDVFLLSLAERFKQHAIGVILSGSGEDGANGAIDVYNHGGQVLAQSAASSLFESMPNATIQRDHPILIDTPAMLAAKVAQMVGSGQ